MAAANESGPIDNHLLKEFPARSLGPEDPECEMLRYDFLCTLDLLHRNLPDHWFCDICLKLHKRIVYKTGGRTYPPCDEGRRQGLFYRLRASNYEIRFEHAQQAVKQHTLGAPHGSPLAVLQRDHEGETISDWPNQPVRSPEQPSLVSSSWLSSRHDYFFGAIIYTPPRLLDDDNRKGERPSDLLTRFGT